MQNKTLTLLLFVLLCASALLNVIAFWSAKHESLIGYADFSSFYSGARMVREGLGTSLYNFDSQREFQQNLFPNVPSRPSPLPFIHPAYETLLFIPLTYFSYSTAYILWTLINISILLILSFLSVSVFHRLRGQVRVVAILCYFSFFPVLIAVLQGQDSIVLLLLVTLAFINLKVNRDYRAGLFLALALFKFQIVLPLALIFLVRRRWKAVFAFVATAVCLILISLQITGWRGLTDYPGLLFEQNQDTATQVNQMRHMTFPSTMPNLRGFIYATFANTMSERLVILGVAVCSLITVLVLISIWFRSRETEEETFNLKFSLSLIAALLISYHLQVHDLLLLLLPILSALNHLATMPGYRILPNWGLSILLLVIAPDALYLITLSYGTFSLLAPIIIVFALLIYGEVAILEKGRPFLLS
ncbi:MAG: glycosyltransferase family 87 protein [Blastocatellia bacterium]